jgi:histidyl-tRNA synthetase
VLRAIDKADKFDWPEIEKLLGTGRKDESGDFTKGAQLDPDQIEAIRRCLRFKITVQQLPGGVWHNHMDGQLPNKFIGMSGEGLMNQGLSELGEIAKLAVSAGYGDDRIRIDPSVVRGLEYYTGPVYEVELLFETKDEKGRLVRFGSVGGGGRYDGLVSRFRGEPVPATGFSIGVSRLQAALSMIGKLDAKPQFGPVVVTVFGGEIAGYQKMVAALRNGGIRAELYLGNPKHSLGQQVKYADKRNSPCAIIQGSDERANGKVLIKDLILGAGLTSIEDREEYLKKQNEAQLLADEAKLVDEVKNVLARHNVTWG